MNLAKQFREFGLLNSINPLSPDAQVIWYNLMQCFNTARWTSSKLVIRTQTLENTCGMTRKRLGTARNVLIQRGLIKYYPARQASGSPAYELVKIYEEENVSVFLKETHSGTHRGTQDATQKGTQSETPIKTKSKTKPSFVGEPTPTKKNNIDKNNYWKNFVETFEKFYLEKKGSKYEYQEKDWACLKKIYKFLKKRCETAKLEWNQENAVDGFNRYLKKAFDKDKWLQDNFSIPNILSQFNQISNGNSKTSATANGTKKSTGGSIEELQALKQRYAAESQQNTEPAGDAGNYEREEWAEAVVV